MSDPKLSELIGPGTADEFTDRYEEAMMKTFARPPRILARGQGARVWDVDGNEYLDLLAGIAVNSLGHAHPFVTAAISEQLATLGHISNLFASPAQIALGEKLDALVTANDPERGARVFFTNSGTEANEAAFKVTRRTGRTRIVAMEGSFHGRTMGALAVTANPSYRQPFEPLPGEVTFVPYGDLDALRAAVDETVAAVVIEPIQGENGVVTLPEGYLVQARELTTAHGALLWLDEIQTGIGRCGHWLASEPTGVTADLVTVAKGLGAGFPIGACVATGATAELLTAGHHGTTFGGNPAAAIAGLSVLSVIEREGLLERTRELGDNLAAAITALEHPLIDHVRGAGLLRGVVLTEQIGPKVVTAALEAGYILNAPRPGVLRLAPPLIIEQADLDRFVHDLPTILESARA
ncbi:acetylornithine transaminase [Enemella sp. A6]|uniref:acetylornithine transaminase n=1 Tax=Enemella sp. A6 TaxID=3440152 RepID=UPI003EB69811